MSAGRLLRGGGFVLAVVVLWETASRLSWIDPVFASTPSAIARRLASLVGDPAFWLGDVRATAAGFAAGWVLALLAGVFLGLLMGWFGTVRDALEPLVLAFYSTPRIALIPLLIVWFGFGFRYKVVFVFLSAVFPVLINTVAGVRDADVRLVRMARSFGAGRAQVFGSVVLPGALPYVLTGVRQSANQGITAVVVGEVFSSGAGLGHVIQRSAQLFQTDLLFAVVALIAVVAVLCNEVLLRLQAFVERGRGDIVGAAVAGAGARR